MGSEGAAVAPPMVEVPMVEAEAVREMRELAAKGWGAKRIAHALAAGTFTFTLGPPGVWRLEKRRK